MKANSNYQSSGEFSPSEDIKKIFIKRVHQLIGMGYAVLVHNEFTNSPEEDITGELAKAIEDVLDDSGSNKWMDKFSIHEEYRIHDQKRKGKKRRRLDIRIDGSMMRPRCRFCFEAKRLGPNHGVSKYLGIDGLQCFLDGRYAKDENIGGMLGYVQSDACDTWAAKIMLNFMDSDEELCVVGTSPWRKHNIAANVPFTYQSGHNRPNLNRQIEIYHILLLFN
ncbi:MAG: hypothetical protein JXA96_11255 [Sedimentisphaerales bacterium]|nr:hypothetical protein [Sedimentisphaerales bacterium]